MSSETTTTMSTSSIDNNNNQTPGPIVMVTLTSQDGTKFQLSLAAALQSKLVKTSLDLYDDDDNNDDKKKKKVMDDAKRNAGQENVDGDNTDEDYHVDLPRVSTNALIKVVEFLKYNEMDPMEVIPFPLQGNSLKDCINQAWYHDFIMTVGEGGSRVVVTKEDKDDSEIDNNNNKKDSNDTKVEEVEQQQQQQKSSMDPPEVRDELFILLDAANFMDIQPLIDLIVLRVTFTIIGKTVQELSDYLNLPMPTKEDEDFARQHHPWIFE